MSRANTGHPARKNLAALLYELRQNIRALVVDKVHLLNAELADLLLAKVLSLAAARSSGTSWTATWAAMSTAWTMSTFTSRRTARALCLLLFLCHNFLPFGIA